MTFCTDTHGPRRMNPCVTYVEPPAGQGFHLSCEIFQHLLDELVIP